MLRKFLKHDQGLSLFLHLIEIATSLCLIVPISAVLAKENLNFGQFLCFGILLVLHVCSFVFVSLLLWFHQSSKHWAVWIHGISTHIGRLIVCSLIIVQCYECVWSVPHIMPVLFILYSCLLMIYGSTSLLRILALRHVYEELPPMVV